MADVKKAAAAAKMAAKPVVETKETEVKAEVKKAAAPAKKAPAKKAETKPAAKKETVKKAAPAKKAAAPAKKAPAKKAEAVINFQFAGKEYKADDFVAIAKDVWKYDLGNKPADFKTVELYVKPEEAKVYYVINGDVTGDFDI